MRIVHKRKDGGVSITTLAIALSKKEIEKHINDLHKNNPDYISSRLIEEQDLPQDREFRDAWTDDLPTNTVDINIEKAQEIKRNKFRILREPLLKQLDIDYQKADEEGSLSKKKEISSKKQALRDITNLVLPKTINELKEFVPSCLKP